MRYITLSCLFFVLFAGALGKSVSRIVGGVQADISQHPYQVSLRLNGKHFCGGSIISERHILTAAHCVQGLIRPPYYNVAVHTGSSMSIGSDGQSYRVQRATVHHAYQGNEAASYHNDIAVLTLADRIQFNYLQRKIELPSTDVYYGETATITGWGIQNYPSSATAPFLQQAVMQVIPSSSCSMYMQTFHLWDEQVCAIQGAGVGACSGDSGGPLVANNEVIGIASWVIPCAQGYPDVYTRVYAYKDWIRNVMYST